jgi:hypothetical protein
MKTQRHHQQQQPRRILTTHRLVHDGRSSRTGGGDENGVIVYGDVYWTELGRGESAEVVFMLH